MRAAALLLCLFGTAGGALAQEDCRAISDPKLRLECYDAAARRQQPPPAATATTPPVDGTVTADTAPPTPPYRAGYAKMMQTGFLRDGYDMSVFSQESPSDIDRRSDPRFNKFPKLVFFGFLGRPFVFNALNNGHLFPNAKKLGFKSVEFSDRGSNGRFLFDITGAPLPPCDINNRVCR